MHNPDYLEPPAYHPRRILVAIVVFTVIILAAIILPVVSHLGDTPSSSSHSTETTIFKSGVLETAGVTGGSEPTVPGSDIPHTPIP